MSQDSLRLLLTGQAEAEDCDHLLALLFSSQSKLNTMGLCNYKQKTWASGQLKNPAQCFKRLSQKERPVFDSQVGRAVGLRVFSLQPWGDYYQGPLHFLPQTSKIPQAKLLSVSLTRKKTAERTRPAAWLHTAGWFRAESKYNSMKIKHIHSSHLGTPLNWLHFCQQCFLTAVYILFRE